MTTAARRCRFCRRELVAVGFISSTTGTQHPEHAQEHCGSPTCDWCLPCHHDRVQQTQAH